jgi:hypothetical protein
MIPQQVLTLVATAAASTALVRCPAASVEAGFESLFDGKTLNGWESPDMSYWTVEESAITGRISREHPCAINQYLVWKGGDLADFELKLKSRIRGEGAVNSGFQFRSRLLPDHDIAGYQVDNNLETDWLVRLYDEFGRHTMAWRGQRTVFDERGEAARSDIAEAKGPAWFRLEEWHEYDLVCAGPRLTLKVDARLAAEVVDKDLRRQDFSGVLGLQLHSGGPSVVQFKDICLQTLKAPPAGGRPRPTINPARTAVFREALAYWDLGSGGHGGAKPLTYHGALEHCQLDVLADGLGSRPAARVAQLSGGYFEAGNGLQVGVSELTVYVRARDPRGLWHSAVLAQGGGQDSILFRLSAVEPGSGGEQQFQFETVADRGSANVSFPLSKIDASAWHELVGRYNGHALELLCDRQVMAQKSWEGGRLSTGSASLLLGAAMESGKATHHFHGEIEEAAIWSKWVSVP